MSKFLAFGELMYRLSPPGREMIFQSRRFDVWLAGAEANVAIQLARLGHDVGFVSRVPDNDLGRGAIEALRSHGIDASGVHLGGKRIGLCFVTAGAGARATDVIYDRAGSSFAEAPLETWDWDTLLAGCDRLHLSGITPALGTGPADAAIAAAEAAGARGIAVSFDGNWRGKLWERRDGDPRAIISRLVIHADLMFGDYRDIALLLGRPFSGEDEDRRREAAEAAFAAFPKLRTIASTARQVEDADRHRLSARVDTRTAHVQSAEVMVSGIVDRIGGGDAFAAGVLHALRSGGDIDDAARAGLAVAALKHSLPGDAALFRQTDIDVYLAGGRDARR